jgi:hypothetical protein
MPCTSRGGLAPLAHGGSQPPVSYLVPQSKSQTSCSVFSLSDWQTNRRNRRGGRNPEAARVTTMGTANQVAVGGASIINRHRALQHFGSEGVMDSLLQRFPETVRGTLCRLRAAWLEIVWERPGPGGPATASGAPLRRPPPKSTIPRPPRPPPPPLPSPPLVDPHPPPPDLRMLDPPPGSRAATRTCAATSTRSAAPPPGSVPNGCSVRQGSSCGR